VLYRLLVGNRGQLLSGGSSLSSVSSVSMPDAGVAFTAAMHPTSHEIVVPSYEHDELHIVGQKPDDS